MKSQRQLKTPTLNPTGPHRKAYMALPTTQVRQPRSLTRVPVASTSEREPELLWCVPHLGLSQTHPLNSQNQSPPQQQLELCMLFPALDPLTQRRSENHLQFLFSILLCLWKFCKNNKFEHFKGPEVINASRKENLYMLKTKSKMLRVIILDYYKSNHVK